jgi:hypothetical protein
MPGITDFIDMATTQLGVSTGAAQAGAGGLLSMLKDKVGGDVFGKVASALPGAADLVGKAPAAGGGGLGGLMAKAGGLLGGSAGGALGAAAMLGKAGIPLDKAKGFGEMFLNFMKSKLSPDLLKSVLAKVGDLGKLFG